MPHRLIPARAASLSIRQQLGALDCSRRGHLALKLKNGGIICRRCMIVIQQPTPTPTPEVTPHADEDQTQVTT